jgi:hypothetical protein
MTAIQDRVSSRHSRGGWRFGIAHDLAQDRNCLSREFARQLLDFFERLWATTRIARLSLLKSVPMSFFEGHTLNFHIDPILFSIWGGSVPREGKRLETFMSTGELRRGICTLTAEIGCR